MEYRVTFLADDNNFLLEKNKEQFQQKHTLKNVHFQRNHVHLKLGLVMEIANQFGPFHFLMSFSPLLPSFSLLLGKYHFQHIHIYSRTHK